MSKGQDVVSKDRSGQTDADAATEPEVRSREAVAREIGATPSTGDTGESSRQDLEERGPLRLDKSGALAGRPKLKPVKAHRKEAPPSEPAADKIESEAQGDDGDAGRSEPADAKGEESSAPNPRPTARPRKAILPPKLGTLRPEGAAAARTEAAEEIQIPAGTFLYGESRKSREVAAFRLDRRPVTNADYEVFVTATRHRRPLYWPAEGLPRELAQHPVVGVDYYDALAYARWKGKDLPYEDEWERAARGTDGRTYPWGNDQELSGANTARVGLKMTVPYDLHRENVTPDGCLDMVGNAWEFTHSPAPGGGVVVRGGSWYDFALYAKTYFRFASQPDARNGTIGFRCCRREEERSDAPREVDEALVDAEIAARRASEAPVDPSSWSAERRDLVIDLPRLRTFVAEARAEALLGAAMPQPKKPVLRTIEAEPEAAKDKPETGTSGTGISEKGAAEAGSVPSAAADPAAGAVPAQAEADAKPLVIPAKDEPVVDAPDDDAPDADAPDDDAPHDDAPDGDEATSDATEDAEAKSDETPAPSRIHIGGGPSSTRVEPSSSAKPARAPKKPRAPLQRSMPLAMWILLGAGFLLFGGLLVVLVNRDGGNVQQEPDVLLPLEGENLAPRSPLADLPDMPSYDAFPWADEAPRLIDGADREAIARLDKGAWMLVFVDPDSDDAPRSLQAAHAMHRRLATHDVNVAVVLPRPRYQADGGALRSSEEIYALLSDEGSRLEGGNTLWDGIPVVLEPVDGSGRGMVRLRTGTASGRPAAVLLRNGLLQTRSTPPRGGYTEASLVGLAKRALK